MKKIIVSKSFYVAALSLSGMFMLHNSANAVDAVAQTGLPCIAYWDGIVEAEYIGGAFGGQPGITPHSNDWHAITLFKTVSECQWNGISWNCSWENWTEANYPQWEQSPSAWFTMYEDLYNNWSAGWMFSATAAASYGHYYSVIEGLQFGSGWVYGTDYCYS